MSGKQVTVAVCFTASFVTPFMSSAVTLALPAIERQFAMSAVTLGWVASSYLLAAAAFLLPFGRLADIYGRRRFFLAGAAVHAVTSVTVALVPSAPLLLAARALQGVGGSMLFGTSVALLVSAVPPEERGRALGVNVAAVYLGLSLGPVIGGLLTQYLGWRSLFGAIALLSAALLLPARALPPDGASPRRERFDAPGALLYSVALTALMLGFTMLPGPAGIALLAAGALGLAGFGRRETRVEHPLIEARLFLRNRVFAFSNLAALINYAATFAVTFLLSLYLQYVRGLDAKSAGLLLIAQPAVMAVCSPVAGRLSDRIEPRLVASAGMAATTAGLVLCAFVGEATTIPSLAGILVVLGFGFALFSSPNTNAVMSSVDRPVYSVASATLSTMRISGQMLSMGVVLLVFATNIGRARLVPALYPRFLGGMRTVFAIFAALSALGVVASLIRGTMHDGNTRILQDAP
jgi:MFS family permease